jgi:hypothetical protein
MDHEILAAQLETKMAIQNNEITMLKQALVEKTKEINHLEFHSTQFFRRYDSLIRVGVRVRSKRLELEKPVEDQDQDLIVVGTLAAYGPDAEADACLYLPHLCCPRQDMETFARSYTYRPIISHEIGCAKFYQILDWSAWANKICSLPKVQVYKESEFCAVFSDLQTKSSQWQASGFHTYLCNDEQGVLLYQRLEEAYQVIHKEYLELWQNS